MTWSEVNTDWRQTDRHTHTHRQTHRQTDTQTDTHTQTGTHTQTDRQTDRVVANLKFWWFQQKFPIHHAFGCSHHVILFCTCAT